MPTGAPPAGGRWSCIPPGLSYRLCPLERPQKRTSPTAEWEEIHLATFAPEIKAGVLEEVTAMLSAEIRRRVPLGSVHDEAVLTRYGEEVFGYPSKPEPAVRG